MKNRTGAYFLMEPLNTRHDHQQAEMQLNLFADMEDMIDDGRQYVVALGPVVEVNHEGTPMMHGQASVTLLRPEDAEIGELVHKGMWPIPNEMMLQEVKTGDCKEFRLTPAGWERIV